MLIFKNFIFDTKTVRPFMVLQFERRIKWTDLSFSPINCNSYVKPFTTSSCDLIKYNSDNEWTDDTFSDRLIKGFKEPKIILKGLYNFAGEFGKLYKEKKENFYLNRRLQCQDPDNLVEMLFTFDSENQLNKFMVNTDSSQYGGYSSASLKLTRQKTCLFSGHICSELIKDGESKFAGYATMVTRKFLRSFKRYKYFDWSYYTHLVFKIKGDGRTYYIHFSVPVAYKAEQSWVFSYPLFTRGGPYWQVSKIALSDFYFISRGNMANIQPSKVPLHRIATLGLTTRQVDGPFKLEIDYIGLELDKFHRQISPYEQYA